MMIAAHELSPFSEWYDLRDELVPFIGERVLGLLAFAICEETGNAQLAGYFRTSLMESGNDVESPQVTETEQLLIDWARAVSTDVASLDDILRARFERAFNPQLRQVIVAFTALTIATNVVASAS